MGTGIVFVVLVAIWVAYFVQYWSRRREHLATARSVEAFAEAMRVLERRPALRGPVGERAGERVSSAYAMSPVRVVGTRPAPRPQVIAKPHPTTPAPSRGRAPRRSTPTPPPAPRRTDRSGPRPRPSATVRMSPSRAVRGLTLLASLAATLLTVALAAFSILLWWVPLVAVAAVAASFLWLRSGVRAEAAARRARRAHRPASRRVRRPLDAPESTASPDIAAEEHEPALPATGAAEPELIETTSVTAADDAGRDGWQPVPVPPPTYTLKAKAERSPAPAAESQVDPARAAEVAPGAGTGVPARTEGEVEVGRTAAYGT